jgi:hypothetical protein
VGDRGMTGARTGDDRAAVRSRCAAAPSTCGSLWTIGGIRATPLTREHGRFSTIHRPYYHHHLLISILSGESERLP